MAFLLLLIMFCLVITTFTFLDPPNLAMLVEVINMNVKPINLEIRKAISEETGAHFYALVSAQRDMCHLHVLQLDCKK